MTPDEVVVRVRSDTDVMLAWQRARGLAQPLRFSSSELTLITTAICEIARNIVRYAGHGTVTLQLVQRGKRRGLKVIARDDGPGIADLARVMEDGYSTSGGLGLGLPGSKRLMDEFDIVSMPGSGTTITMTKWEH
jgi:serine/threonine-protein kinase RsbT